MKFDETSSGLTATEDTSCASNDDATEDLSSFPCGFRGNVEIGYDASENHRFTLGYLRDYKDVFFTNYVAMNRYYLFYRGGFADILELQLGGELNQQAYRGEVTRNDNWFRIRSDLVISPTPFLDVTPGVWYTGRRSADGQVADIEYDDINAHLALTFTY